MSQANENTISETNEAVMKRAAVDEDAEDEQLDKTHTGGEADQTKQQEGLE